MSAPIEPFPNRERDEPRSTRNLNKDEPVIAPQLQPSPSVFASLARAWRDKSAPSALRRVLVVDDEEPVRRFVARVLKEGGYEAVVACDGADALKIVQKEPPFDILVTDVMMPQMNGDELVRRLRQLEPWLKVLYLTGFSDTLFKEKATLWQDEAFLEKPCTVKGLLEAVSLVAVGRIDTPRAG